MCYNGRIIRNAYQVDDECCDRALEHPVGYAGVRVIGYEVSGTLQKNFGSTRGGRLLDVYIRIQGKILNDGFCLLSTSSLFFRVRCLISGDDAAYDQDNQERQLFLAIRLFFLLLSHN